MNRINYDTLIQAQEEDIHVYEFGKDNLISLKIDNTYPYALKWWEKILSVFLRAVVLLVMPLLLFVKHGLIVHGRRNLRKLKGGAITISNHVLPLDGPIVAQSVFPHAVVYQSLEDNFKLPFIRHLIRWLGGMPIPNAVTARPAYLKATNHFLAQGKFIQIYPEASLWPYYNGIRSFKTGAFHFAVKFQVPIVPISIHFRQARGLDKLFPAKNNLITVHIGKPLYPNEQLPLKQSMDDLLKRTHSYMVRSNRYFKWLDHQKTVESEKQEEEII